MLFAYSIWCIDISVSAIISSNNGDNFVVSGLYFKNVEPRIMYHLALSILTTIWLIMCSMATWKLIKK